MPDLLTRPWLRPFSHPLVGVLGSIASLIGLALAVYFYLASRAVPLVTVAIHPVRTPIVQSGGLSKLAVLFDGQRLAGDVTAVQLALWNDGKAPVRAEDILQPVVIKLNAPILEASFRKRTRAVCGFELHRTAAQNVVGIRWKVLEADDGAVIQLIYAGDIKVPIQVSGAVVGQRPTPRRQPPRRVGFGT